jgi:ferredoxin-NADP reductase
MEGRTILVKGKNTTVKTSIDWQIATVKEIRRETPRVKTFTLGLPNWRPHKAGQHYDIRLTAPDGYQAQRSYSIASEPERNGEIDLTVEKIEDGEVSPYLHDVLMRGDRIEVRGPIGGYFVWEATMEEPLLLIAGGSGIVPLMSMLRHRAAAGAEVPACLLYSSRTFDDIIYCKELDELKSGKNGPKIFQTLTRSQPSGWKGFGRRMDQKMVEDVAGTLGSNFQAYICGPTLLVEAAADYLVAIGVASWRIRTERFGPTGPVKDG